MVGCDSEHWACILWRVQQLWGRSMAVWSCIVCDQDDGWYFDYDRVGLDKLGGFCLYVSWIGCMLQCWNMRCSVVEKYMCYDGRTALPLLLGLWRIGRSKSMGVPLGEADLKPIRQQTSPWLNLGLIEITQLRNENRRYYFDL